MDNPRHDESVLAREGETTTPLGASETFQTPWFNTRDFVSVTAAWYTDQAGEAIIQHSSDGINVGLEDIFDATVGNGSRTVPVKSRYIRVCFRLGSRAQSEFRLQTLLNPVAIQADETNGATKYHGQGGDEVFVSHTHPLPVELTASTSSTLDQLLDELKKTNQILNMIFEVEC